jgi:hypothetical protein
VRRILLVVLAVLIAAVVGIAFLGVAQVPLLSSVFGTDHARDLGMVRDQGAYDTLVAKYGIEMPSPAGQYTLSSRHTRSGSFAFDDVVSEATLAAIREFQAPDSRVKDLQFRIHPGEVELSAFVQVPGYPLAGPVYGRFAVGRTGDQSVSVSISQLDYGRLGVPGNIASDVQARLEDYVNQRLVEAGVHIERLELGDGSVSFAGDLPQTIEAAPPEPNAVP